MRYNPLFGVMVILCIVLVSVLVVTRFATPLRTERIPASSNPDMLQKSQSYIACGCGCCGGVEPEARCLFHAKGDNLRWIMENEKKSSKNPGCAQAGCSFGVKYTYCD